MYEKKYVNYGKDLFYCLILEKKISEKYFSPPNTFQRNVSQDKKWLQMKGQIQIGVVIFCVKISKRFMTTLPLSAIQNSF